MLILAIETTGKYASAALISEDGRFEVAESFEQMNHLKEIMSLIDESLSKMGAGKGDITHVAASAGPGSFTGIRIGVTTARTLGQMLEIPCVCVSSLEGMAKRAFDYAEANGCRYICPIINARRHQTYAYIAELSPDMKHYVEEKQYMIEEIIELLMSAGEKVLFTGDGIDAYESIIREKMPEELFVLAPEEIRYQNAKEVAELALEKALSEDVCTYEELMPEYMRLSEAEMRLKEGTLSRKISEANV